MSLTGIVLSDDNITMEGAMPTAEAMTVDERRKYLGLMTIRYARAKRKERSHLLDDMEHFTALDRKTLIRLINGDLTRQPRQKQRGCTYDAAVGDVVRIIADSFDYVCAERLTPNLPWMAVCLAQHGELSIFPSVLAKLEHISVCTVRRMLQPMTPTQRHLPRPTAGPANPLTRDIPMTRIAWDEDAPGHFEVDLVHHCGASADGQYGHTLQLIDVATGWSERSGMLGRSNVAMQKALTRTQQRLPFAIVELHPDNGSEFFNTPIMRYFSMELKTTLLSRSRPFHKNDNRFVEQKNSSLVRAYVGDQRLDTTMQILILNDLYEKMWVYYNLFQPVLRLAEKIVVPVDGGASKIRRRYDVARTPFDRLCATGILTTERQNDLNRLRDQTNPRRLKQEVYAILDRLLSLPCADSAREK
jgi:hypothetical protein